MVEFFVKQAGLVKKMLVARATEIDSLAVDLCSQLEVLAWGE